MSRGFLTTGPERNSEDFCLAGGRGRASDYQPYEPIRLNDGAASAFHPKRTLGSAPDLDVTFNDEKDRDAARNLMHLLEQAEGQLERPSSSKIAMGQVVEKKPFI